MLFSDCFMAICSKAQMNTSTPHAQPCTKVLCGFCVNSAEAQVWPGSYIFTESTCCCWLGATRHCTKLDTQKCLEQTKMRKKCENTGRGRVLHIYTLLAWADYESMGPWAHISKGHHHLSYTGARHTDFWGTFVCLWSHYASFVGLCLFVVMLSILRIVLCFLEVNLSLFLVDMC